MSGNGALLVVIATLLLTACAEEKAQPGATTAPPVGGCGVEASVPDGATLRADDLPAVEGKVSRRYIVLPQARCSGVARRPDQCDTFPWATEKNLYALGGRAWLAVTLGRTVREQIVLFAPDSSFADSYVGAAEGCGFATLTVLDGEPATLERSRDGSTEIVYMTSRSMIWMASTDPAVGVAELVRLAGVAEERSAALSLPR